MRTFACALILCVSLPTTAAAAGPGARPRREPGALRELTAGANSRGKPWVEVRLSAVRAVAGGGERPGPVLLEAEGATAGGRAFRALLLAPVEEAWEGAARVQARRVLAHGVPALVGAIRAGSSGDGERRAAGCILVDAGNLLAGPATGAAVTLAGHAVNARLSDLAPGLAFLRAQGSTFVAGVGQVQPADGGPEQAARPASAATGAAPAGALDGSGRVLTTSLGAVARIEGRLTSEHGAQNIIAILIGLLVPAPPTP